MEQTSEILTPSKPVLELLGLYVRYLADQMRLRDWKFDVGYDDDQIEPGLIRIAPCRPEAAVVFGPKLMSMYAAERRYVVVHELTHCHLQPMRDSVGTAESLLLNTWPVIRKSHDNAVENAVHNLAATLSAYLPTFEQWRYAARLSEHVGLPEPQRPGRRRVRASKRRH